MAKALPIDIEAKLSSKKRDYFEYKGVQYDVTWGDDNPTIRHGGPFDRGSADSYYNRAPCPHYFLGGTGTSLKVERSAMTQKEIDEYYAGYEYNEISGDRKDWG